jgi:thioredoxin-dependent peroxiredoxin
LERLALLSILTIGSVWAATPPGVGGTAPDFSLSRAQGGNPMRLSEATAKGKVVLVVLRGYPGYQCPMCNRQFQDFIRNAKTFEGLRVILVYPGAAEGLEAKAKEFMTGKAFPENFDLLLDPAYVFTDLYGLRWDKAGETAYPSTFLIDSRGVVTFAKISRTHGDRVTAVEIGAALKKD